MVLESLVNSANTITQLITSFVVAPLLIFFASIAAGKLLRNLLRAGLSAVELDNHVKRITKQPIPAVELIAGVAAAIIYTIGTLWALRVATILDEATYVVFALLGLLAVLAISLGARDFLPNYFAGRKHRKQLTLGEQLTTIDARGEITSIGLLSVQIRNEYEETIAIPYSSLE